MNKRLQWRNSPLPFFEFQIHWGEFLYCDDTLGTSGASATWSEPVWECVAWDRSRSAPLQKTEGFSQSSFAVYGSWLCWWFAGDFEAFLRRCYELEMWLLATFSATWMVVQRRVGLDVAQLTQIWAGGPNQVISHFPTGTGGSSWKRGR